MKGLTRFGALCGVVVALVCLSGVLATADPGGGATVITEFGCVIIPPDWGGPIVLVTTDTHSVVTPSGNSKLTCKFDIPDGLEPAKAEKYNDFWCSTFAGLTTDSQSVVSPGGNITLQCMVKPDPNP